MNELPRVKVINPGDNWLGTEYYINEKKIPNVKAVDFRVAVDEVPTFTFETIGLPEIDMPGDIQFSFTPQTIEEAKKIIEHGMKNKHRVDLESQKGCVAAYIDGEHIPACEKIELDNKECMEFIPNEEVLFSQYVQADLSRYTRFAMIVLRNELLKHGDLYNGFLASMRSAIDDKFWDSRSTVGPMCDIGGEDFDEAAELMLKRVIGEE